MKTISFPRLSALILAILGATLLLTLFAISVTAASPSATASHAHTPTLLEASTPITLPSPSWRVGITADGLYRLSYEALDAAGVPTDATPSAYHLLWRGQEVALQEVGDGDSAFEPGEALLFYAQKFHGSTQDEKYTDENVYWLYVDAGAAGLRMEARTDRLHTVYLPLVLGASGGDAGTAEPSWYTATAHAEENLAHWARWSTTPGTDTTWFWERITTDAFPLTGTYTITLTEPVPTTYNATLRVEVAGRSYDFFADPDHHLRLAVNGATIGDVTWDGQVGAVLTLTIPSSALVDGANRIDVTVLTDLSDLQDIYIDHIDISYRRAYVAEEDQLAWTAPSSGVQLALISGFSTADVALYDITHPLTPTHLVSAATSSSGPDYALRLRDFAAAGTAYLAVAETAVTDVPALSAYYPPSDLISPITGADEIIIAHGDFITAIEPLADHRRAQGLRVRVVDVEDVYALFNGGVVHPEAIRSFVAHAYANWPGRPPSLLLLVGDGNFNPKGYNPASYGAFVPTRIPPYLEFADPDQGEVPVDSRYGDVDWDGMPEVAVGRIPANSAEQVAGVVDKIIAYENEPPAAWMDRVIHVADDGEVLNEGYSLVLDGLAQDYLPMSVETRTVYIEDYCASPSYSPCPSATLALTQTWSAGGALLSYAGHGAVHRWAHEPLLLNTQLQSLTGTAGLPFVISLDCWDGYWMFPPKYPAFGNRDIHSTGEWATTVLTDRGAIAVFGPAGLGYIGLEEFMVQRMYQAMFEEGNFQLGSLTQEGRQVIPFAYVARTYTLLGDPAITLPWWDHITATPDIYTMTVGTSVPLSTAFAVTGTTRFGQDFAVTPAWTADAGDIDGWGNYTAPNYATTVQLTAHMGAVSTTVTVNVVEEDTSAAVTSSGSQNKTAWAPAYLPIGLSVAALATLQEKLLRRRRERREWKSGQNQV
ncbi:MAG: hypothetical protein JW918_14750 [Anaerolineae bacterium]|nr:hypothetical protein [Anaerolineae bacterium]